MNNTLITDIKAKTDTLVKHFEETGNVNNYEEIEKYEEIVRYTIESRKKGKLQSGDYFVGAASSN